MAVERIVTGIEAIRTAIDLQKEVREESKYCTMNVRTYIVQVLSNRYKTFALIDYLVESVRLYV